MSEKKRVLFVCVENSCRSQIAEAFARIHGGNSVEAFSAGSRPSGIVNPKAIETMREIGYDLSTHASKSLDAVPAVTYDLVATMGCGDECPFIAAVRREDWQIPDPKNAPAYPATGIFRSNMVVQKVFKGKLRAGQKLSVGQGTGADCSWMFAKTDIGNEYLLYLGPKPVMNGMWSVSTCSRSGKMKDRADDLRYLNKRRHPKGR